MLLARSLTAFALAALSAAAAQTPLPELRIEPTAGGSIFYIRNNSPQPLTAWLIELVDYPGSSYSLWQDDLAEPIPPGGQKKIPVSNMTVGAVPDYVKVRAAIYADGSSAGLAEKVEQLVDRRRINLATARELIARLEKAKAASTPKPALLADLKQWAASLQPAVSISRNASRALINQAARTLDSGSLEEALAQIRTTERQLAASKPAF